MLDRTVKAEAKLARNWQDWDTSEQIPIINDLVVKVVVARESITGDVPESLALERLKKDFPIDWEAQRSPENSLKTGYLQGIYRISRPF